MSHVIVAGTFAGGITIYGPFVSTRGGDGEHQAIKWARCNGKTDLTDVPWEAVALESPLSEDEAEALTCYTCGEHYDETTLCECEIEERRQQIEAARQRPSYDPLGGGGGWGRSDLPYGQGGGGD